MTKKFKYLNSNISQKQHGSLIVNENGGPLDITSVVSLDKYRNQLPNLYNGKIVYSLEDNDIKYYDDSDANVDSSSHWYSMTSQVQPKDKEDNLDIYLVDQSTHKIYSSSIDDSTAIKIETFPQDKKSLILQPIVLLKSNKNKENEDRYYPIEEDSKIVEINIIKNGVETPDIFITNDNFDNIINTFEITANITCQDGKLLSLHKNVITGKTLSDLKLKALPYLNEDNPSILQHGNIVTTGESYDIAQSNEKIATSLNVYPGKIFISNDGKATGYIINGSRNYNNIIHNFYHFSKDDLKAVTLNLNKQVQQEDKLKLDKNISILSLGNLTLDSSGNYNYTPPFTDIEKYSYFDPYEFEASYTFSTSKYIINYSSESIKYQWDVKETTDPRYSDSKNPDKPEFQINGDSNKRVLNLGLRNDNIVNDILINLTTIVPYYTIENNIISDKKEESILSEKKIILLGQHYLDFATSQPGIYTSETPYMHYALYFTKVDDAEYFVKYFKQDYIRFKTLGGNDASKELLDLVPNMMAYSKSDRTIVYYDCINKKDTQSNDEISKALKKLETIKAEDKKSFVSIRFIQTTNNGSYNNTNYIDYGKYKIVAYQVNDKKDTNDDKVLSNDTTTQAFEHILKNTSYKFDSSYYYGNTTPGINQITTKLTLDSPNNLVRDDLIKLSDTADKEINAKNIDISDVNIDASYGELTENIIADTSTNSGTIFKKSIIKKLKDGSTTFNNNDYEEIRLPFYRVDPEINSIESQYKNSKGENIYISDIILNGKSYETYKIPTGSYQIKKVEVNQEVKFDDNSTYTLNSSDSDIILSVNSIEEPITDTLKVIDTKNENLNVSNTNSISNSIVSKKVISINNGNNVGIISGSLSDEHTLLGERKFGSNNEIFVRYTGTTENKMTGIAETSRVKIDPHTLSITLNRPNTPFMPGNQGIVQYSVDIKYNNNKVSQDDYKIDWSTSSNDVIITKNDINTITLSSNKVVTDFNLNYDITIFGDNKISCTEALKCGNPIKVLNVSYKVGIKENSTYTIKNFAHTSYIENDNEEAIFHITPELGNGIDWNNIPISSIKLESTLDNNQIECNIYSDETCQTIINTVDNHDWYKNSNGFYVKPISTSYISSNGFKNFKFSLFKSDATEDSDITVTVAKPNLTLDNISFVAYGNNKEGISTVDNTPVDLYYTIKGTNIHPDYITFKDEDSNVIDVNKDLYTGNARNLTSSYYIANRAILISYTDNGVDSNSEIKVLYTYIPQNKSIGKSINIFGLYQNELQKSCIIYVHNHNEKINLPANNPTWHYKDSDGNQRKVYDGIIDNTGSMICTNDANIIKIDDNEDIYVNPKYNVSISCNSSEYTQSLDIQAYLNNNNFVNQHFVNKNPIIQYSVEYDTEFIGNVTVNTTSSIENGVTQYSLTPIFNKINNISNPNTGWDSIGKTLVSLDFIFTNTDISKTLSFLNGTVNGNTVTLSYNKDTGILQEGHSLKFKSISNEAFNIQYNLKITYYNGYSYIVPYSFTIGVKLDSFEIQGTPIDNNLIINDKTYNINNVINNLKVVNTSTKSEVPNPIISVSMDSNEGIVSNNNDITILSPNPHVTVTFNPTYNGFGGKIVSKTFQLTAEANVDSIKINDGQGDIDSQDIILLGQIDEPISYTITGQNLKYLVNKKASQAISFGLQNSTLNYITLSTDSNNLPANNESGTLKGTIDTNNYGSTLKDIIKARIKANNYNSVIVALQVAGITINKALGNSLATYTFNLKLRTPKILGIEPGYALYNIINPDLSLGINASIGNGTSKTLGQLGETLAIDPNDGSLLGGWEDGNSSNIKFIPTSKGIIEDKDYTVSLTINDQTVRANGQLKVVDCSNIKAEYDILDFNSLVEDSNIYNDVEFTMSGKNLSKFHDLNGESYLGISDTLTGKPRKLHNVINIKSSTDTSLVFTLDDTAWDLFKDNTYFMTDSSFTYDKQFSGILYLNEDSYAYLDSPGGVSQILYNVRTLNTFNSTNNLKGFYDINNNTWGIYDQYIFFKYFEDSSNRSISPLFDAIYKSRQNYQNRNNIRIIETNQVEDNTNNPSYLKNISDAAPTTWYNHLVSVKATSEADGTYSQIFKNTDYYLTYYHINNVNPVLENNTLEFKFQNMLSRRHFNLDLIQLRFALNSSYDVSELTGLYAPIWSNAQLYQDGSVNLENWVGNLTMGNGGGNYITSDIQHDKYEEMNLDLKTKDFLHFNVLPPEFTVHFSIKGDSIAIAHIGDNTRLAYIDSTKNGTITWKQKLGKVVTNSIIYSDSAARVVNGLGDEYNKDNYGLVAQCLGTSTLSGYYEYNYNGETKKYIIPSIDIKIENKIILMLEIDEPDMDNTISGYGVYINNIPIYYYRTGEEFSLKSENYYVKLESINSTTSDTYGLSYSCRFEISSLGNHISDIGKVNLPNITIRCQSTKTISILLFEEDGNSVITAKDVNQSNSTGSNYVQQHSIQNFTFDARGLNNDFKSYKFKYKITVNH